MKVAITGLGLLTAAGRGADATEAALRAGRDGLGRLSRFASPRCGHLPVAEVRGVEEAPRTVALARPALADALASAGLDGGQAALASLRVGLAVGCTVGGMPETERALAALAREERPVSPEAWPEVWAGHETGATTAALAAAFGLRGPALTIANACASGAQALADGADLLAAGLADVVVAGGVDALCRLTLNGFASLLAVDPAGCRPFDARRGGMSLGEGAAFLVLEPLERARARGARPLALLAGTGSTCDAHHPTRPEPEGRGAEAAMRAALAAAGLEPGAIDYVNAHGTGTPDNDRAEGRALRRLFGEALPPVSSTKRAFGHTLGAAGAIEAAVCVLALERGFLPGTPGFATPDPECALTPLAASRPGAPRACLSNSFGFGGANTALVLRAPEGP